MNSLLTYTIVPAKISLPEKGKTSNVKRTTGLKYSGRYHRCLEKGARPIRLPKKWGGPSQDSSLIFTGNKSDTLYFHMTKLKNNENQDVK